MPRLSLRPYLAFVLLLCLGRTLLPEAWVLALHGHAHTTEEPAFAQGKLRKGQALFTPKHTHCHEETFYNVPFQGRAAGGGAVAPAATQLPPAGGTHRAGQLGHGPAPLGPARAPGGPGTTRLIPS